MRLGGVPVIHPAGGVSAVRALVMEFVMCGLPSQDCDDHKEYHFRSGESPIIQIT